MAKNECFPESEGIATPACALVRNDVMCTEGIATPVCEPARNDTELERGNLVWLHIEELHPHPDNPRKALGDLTELADSIRENGVYQNLTVVPGHWVSMEEYVRIAKAEGVPRDMAAASYEPKVMWEESGYTVIIGHRRRAASELAGLQHLPCVITSMTEAEQVSTMLLENMQRSDLTVFEQAQGFQMMIDLGATAEDIAQKTGFSKTTVNRRLKMAQLDQTVLQTVAQRQTTMEDFDKLAKIEDLGKRNEVLAQMGTNNFTSAITLAMRRQEVGKKLPLAHAVVKDLNAKKIRNSETWNGDYKRLGQEINIREWDGDVPVEYGEERKIFYTLDEEYGKLSFYVRNPKAKQQPQKSQKELDREQQIREVHEQLGRMNEIHYQLRRDFVNRMKVGNHNRMAVFQGALLMCAGKTVCYLSSDRSTVLKLLKLEDIYPNRTGKGIAEAFDDLDPDEWPKLIYAMVADSPTESYSTRYQSEYPRHMESTVLDLVYRWLCWCGYEMSDDEIAMQNGTHELLNMGEEKKK